MQSLLFTQNFWGDKHTGFDALTQNLKLACRSTSDLIDFIRESCALDDSYHKFASKLAKQAGSFTTAGTFRPCWSIVRHMTEKIGQFHMTLAQDRQILLKDVQKYLEEQQKAHKSVKESEASTQEVVHSFQVTSTQLHKAKEAYHSRYAEYQRLLRSDSCSSRELEKSEVKLKKAQDEYRYSVEKYNNLRNQFVGKMQSSCIQFQEIEVAHLEQMREFLQRYGAVWLTVRDSLDDLVERFNRELAEMTTEHLLQLFVKNRGTGSFEPQTVSFEDAEVASLLANVTTDRTNMVFGGTLLGSKLVDGGMNNELRASSALAVGDTELKIDGHGSGVSLNDLNVDTVSVGSASLNVPPITSATVSIRPKRREGLFRRRRSSNHERSPSATEDVTGSPVMSSTSLSAFNLVTKSGRRGFGSLSNGKDKLGRKMESKADVRTTEDWRVNTPAEQPKDEEGFSIPPSDPWAVGIVSGSHDTDRSSDESEGDVDVIGRSFRGLKVKIRPVGEFAPCVSTCLTSDTLTTDARQDLCDQTIVPDHSIEPESKSDYPSKLDGTQSFPDPSSSGAVNCFVGSSFLQRLPTAPALPPPPSITSSTGQSIKQLTSDVLVANRKDSSSPQFNSDFNDRKTWSRKSNPCPRSHQSPLVTVQPTTIPGSTSGLSSPPCGPTVTKAGLHPHWSIPVARCSSAIPTITSPPSSGKSRQPSDLTDMRSNWLAFDAEFGSSLDTNPNYPQEKVCWPFYETPNSPPDGSGISSHVSPVHPEPPLRKRNPVSAVTESDRPTILTNHVDFQPASPSLHTSDFHPVQPVSVAAALVETWRARFPNGGGSSFFTAAKITPPPEHEISGSLTVAFPTSVVKDLVTFQLANPLRIRLDNAVRMKNLQSNLIGALIDEVSIDFPVSACSSYCVTIPGSALIPKLTDLLSHTTQSDPGAVQSYVKLDVLTYDVDVNVVPALSPPIYICTYWRCEQDATDFRLDYVTQWPNENRPLTNRSRGDLRIVMNVDGNVSRMQSLPAGMWISGSNRAVWTIPLSSTVHQQSLPIGDLTAHNRDPNATFGTLRAKFFLQTGPGRPQPVSLQFYKEDVLASGVQLILEGTDYRLSLCKRRIVADKYICDPPSQTSRFQVHPTAQPKSSVQLQSPADLSLPSPSDLFSP